MASYMAQIVLLVACLILRCGGDRPARQISFCADNPSINCPDLNRTSQICTAFPDSEETKLYCPKFCGLCGTDHSQPPQQTQAPSKAPMVTPPLVGTTTAPYTGPCVDDPLFKCADMDHTAKICTVYRDDETTRKYCPKYCGICGNGQAPKSTQSVVGVPTGSQTPAPYTGPCVDDPLFKCADMDHTAKICTLYRDDQQTRKYCPKYCGICGNGNVHMTTQSVVGVPTGSQTPAPYTGPCVDDPSFNCADMDHTAKICTLYKDDQQTRKYCPKYCGLCGNGNVHITTQSVVGVPTGSQTPPPYTGPCVDDPSFKCADMDHTAKICTLYRDDQQTRKYCPKYCGLCGNGNAHITTQSVVGVPTGSQTPAPYTGPCVDDPSFKCADMDHTAKICTLYRDDQQTRKYCPKYCGLCGNVQTVTTVPPSVTTLASVGGVCEDNPNFDCADIDNTAHICTAFKDNPETMKNCPKYCGLCTSGKTQPLHQTTTHTHSETTTPRSLASTATTGARSTTHNPLRVTTHGDIHTTLSQGTTHSPLRVTTHGDIHTTLSQGTTHSPLHVTTHGDIHTTLSQGTTHSPLHVTTHGDIHTTLSQGTTHSPLHVTTHGDIHTTLSQGTTHSPLHVTSHKDVLITKSMTTTKPMPAATKTSETTIRRHSETATTKHLHLATMGPTDTVKPSQLTTTGSPESTTPLSLQAIFSGTFHNSDLDKDGVITFLEFEELWMKLDINGDNRVTTWEYSASTHFSKYVATELFTYIDHDHNNVITIQEVPRIFMEYDTNNDGIIEKEEYINEYTRIYMFVKNSFN